MGLSGPHQAGVAGTSSGLAVVLASGQRIHIGSQQARPKVGAILSIVDSCRRMKIPDRDHRAVVVPGPADTSTQRLAELTRAARTARNR